MRPKGSIKPWNPVVGIQRLYGADGYIYLRPVTSAYVFGTWTSNTTNIKVVEASGQAQGIDQTGAVSGPRRAVGLDETNQAPDRGVHEGSS